MPVAILDLSLMSPLLITSGALLWRRHADGWWLGTVAGIQASLYLAVLSVNSAAAVIRGTVDGPGELPVWGAVAILSAGATLLLLVRAGQPQRPLRAA